MMAQYMASIQQQQQQQNSRPEQQSSPSDQSILTGTPPHQTNSRASPASTALVMSSNNISNQNNHNHHHHSLSQQHQQPVGRHLMPSSNQIAMNNGRLSAQMSQSQAPAHQAGQQQQHHHHQGPNGRPHPMVRQFTCHSKSQSAGVVVSVPGITSNLASLNQNQPHMHHNHSNHSNHNSHLMANGNTHNSHHQQSNHNSTANIIAASKLASSGYLPDPYIFAHSITDMSCDNISNVSAMIEGQPNGPAPGYYAKQAPISRQTRKGVVSGGNVGKGASAANCPSVAQKKQPEFLPICDLMFNLISMIIYFCGNTFNIISLIALNYHPAMYIWAVIGTAFVFASNITCQYISYKWLYRSKLDECRRKQEAEEELEQEEGCERGSFYHRRSQMNAGRGDYPCGSCSWLPDRATELHLKFLISIAIDAVTHLLCLGFLIRYIKLVLPVDDTARVKREARDLSVLRMLHGFIQSAPLLLLQAYLIYQPQSFQSSPITNLNVTSAVLSLLNVSWALASFTKYAREKYMHKFVLTWLGIFSQLVWRLGTISSRVVALTIYAYYYGYWMMVVLALHWLTMFLWLIKPGNLFRDKVAMTPTKKVSFASAVAWIYCFCYINLEDQASKLKTICFYLIMFLENNLLLTVCLQFPPTVNSNFKYLSMLVIYTAFVVGILFMFLYYKYFHVNVLNNGLSCSQESVDSIADQLSPAGKKIAGYNPGTLRLKADDVISQPGQRYHSNISVNLNAHHHSGSHPEIGSRNQKPPYLTHNQAPLPQSGVFSCKNDTGFRKQKITSTHERHHY